MWTTCETLLTKMANLTKWSNTLKALKGLISKWNGAIIPYHIRNQSFGHPPFLIYLYLKFTELFFLSEKKTKTLAVRQIFHSIHHGGTPTPTITHFFIKTQFMRTTCLKSSSFLRIDFESYWRSFIPNNFFSHSMLSN